MPTFPYPLSLDDGNSLPNTRVGNSGVGSPANDNNLQANAIIALETKLGIDSSADTTSIDYKVVHKLGRVAFTVGVTGSGCDYECDGVADDVQINAAIAAGNAVLVGLGTFNLAAEININKSNFTFEGQGNGTKFFVSNSANIRSAVAITGSGTVEVKLKDFMIDGNKGNQSFGDGIYINTPWVSTDTQHTIEDVYVYNCKNNGIEVAQNSDSRVLQFNRVHCKNIDGNGFYFAYPSQTDSTFYDCIADTIGLNGFYVGGANNHFTDCKTFYCGSAGGNNHGFYIVAYNNYFNNCEAQDNYQSGFYSANEGDATYGTQRNTLINCVADSNGQNGGTTYACGLQLIDCSNWQIIGGLYMTRPYPSFTQRKGISLQGTTTGTVTIGVKGTGNSSALYSDTSSGTNYPFAVEGTTSKLANSLTLGTNQLNVGTASAYFGSTTTRLLLDGGTNTMQFQNFADIFLNVTNPNFSLFSASGQTLSIVNAGGGSANLTVQNKITTTDFVMNSTTHGLKFPSMTTTQKNAISSPQAGETVYDSTLATLSVYNGSAWKTVTVT